MTNHKKSDSNPAIRPAVFDEKDAATYIGMSAAFLRRARMTGRTKSGSTGPAFVKVPGGRGIRYRLTDLDAWLDANVHSGDDKEPTS